MLYLLDGTHTIQIFDKTYEPTDFPVKVYYRYDKEGEFIDLSSANFYRNLADNPDTEVYSEANWFPRSYWNLAEGKESSLVDNSVKILSCATGLRKSYDYTELLGTLKYGELIQAKLNLIDIGNEICNYRHFHSIYYDDIYKSKGYLKNSYGYDKQK